MQAHKLHGRMDDVVWNPPILRFVIERHGGTVCGSTRAELQHWEVDLNNRSARVVKTGHWQLVAMAPRISIKGIADEIVKAILSGRDDDRVQRLDDDELKVVASRIFPDRSGFKRTLLGRRKKLLEYLHEKLRVHGWRRSGANGFVRMKDESVVDVVGER